MDRIVPYGAQADLAEKTKQKKEGKKKTTQCMANVGPQQSWRGTHGAHRGEGGVGLAPNTLSKNTLILIGWKRNKKNDT